MTDAGASRYCRHCRKQVEAVRNTYKWFHVLLMVLTLPLWLAVGFGYAYEPPPGRRCPECGNRVFRRRGPRNRPES